VINRLRLLDTQHLLPKMILNTTKRFGLVSIFLHWLMAVVVLGLFALGWYMVDLTYYDSLYNTLPFIHQSIGTLVALIFLFRIVWIRVSPVPGPLQGNSRFEIITSRLMHSVLYFLIALIVLSGYLISTADGSGIDVFDLFEVPATVTGIPQQEDIAGLIHEYLAYILIGLVLVHAAAALKHHYVDRDNSLRRILGIG
jgi:cytochrome b561